MQKILFLGFPIILIPFFLITGPLIPDAIVTIGSLLFLVFIFYKKKIYLFNNKFLIFFLIFWIFISLNSFFSGNLISIKSSFTYLRFGLFMILLIYLSNYYENFHNKFKNIILFSFLILFFDSIFQYSFGFNILGYEKTSRISSFFGDELIMGSYVIKLFPLFVFLYFFQNQKILITYTLLSLILISLLLIFLSGERSALGLYFLYIFLLSFVLFDNFKSYLIYIISIIFLSSIILINFDHLRYRFVTQFFNDLKIKTEKIVGETENIKESKSINKLYIFTKAHNQMIVTSYKMFLDKPLTGHGSKSYRLKCNDIKYYANDDEKFCSTHPHNYYLQMLAENGLIGFLFISIVFFYFFISFFKNIFSGKRKKLVNLIYLANIINFWPVIPHGNFFNNWISITIFLSLGFYLSLRNRDALKNQ